MKWIKTFEAFNFDFDLYKEISYLEFRELCRREIINPTQEKLEEIYQILANNTKKEITNPKLGDSVDYIQHYLYEDSRGSFDIYPDFYFYEVDLYKSHDVYGLRNNYLYVTEITENFYLILYSIIPDGKESIYRNPFYFICDDLVGIEEFVKNQLNLRKFELEEFP